MVFLGQFLCIYGKIYIHLAAMHKLMNDVALQNIVYIHTGLYTVHMKCVALESRQVSFSHSSSFETDLTYFCPLPVQSAVYFMYKNNIHCIQLHLLSQRSADKSPFLILSFLKRTTPPSVDFRCKILGSLHTYKSGSLLARK